jgi:hypothetical protein
MIECSDCNYMVHPTDFTKEGFPKHTCSGSKLKAREDVYLNHWLYNEARQYTESVRREQILKGAAKYPTPLGDAPWTPEELVHHAMMENIDQNHYLVMLLHEVKKLRDENTSIKAELAHLYSLKDGL